MMLSTRLAEVLSLANTERLNILVSPEVKEQLTKIAKAESLSVSTYVRLLIINDLKNKKEEK